MATGRISINTVKALKSGAKDICLWDSELRGFGVKMTPAGTRTYLVQYRVGGRRGRTRRVTIGQHGSPWTPDKAREQAKRILGQVANKEDPAEARLNTSPRIDRYPERLILPTHNGLVGSESVYTVLTRATMHLSQMANCDASCTPPRTP